MTFEKDVFFLSAQEKITEVNIFADQYSLGELFQGDHLGYDCSSPEEFEEIRKYFEIHCQYLYQSIIADRLIALIRLTDPFSTSFGPIHFLELADQKKDLSQKSGFEHIEVCVKEKSLEEVLQILEQKGIPFQRAEKPHRVTWNRRISSDFILKIEPNFLLEKIKREEMS